MRVLYVTSYHRTGGWLAEAFAADSASEVILEEAVGVTAGVARLRDEMYDAVLVSHDPEQLDALGLIEGLRGGGTEEPILVLGDQSEQEMNALCFEVGADAYVCVHTATVRTLIWLVARAIERHTLIRENRRLLQADRSRLQQEQNEAERLLSQQRALICGLEALQAAARQRREHEDGSEESLAEHECRGGADPEKTLPLPENLVAHYRELLRAYVIMGSGNLGCEMARLADLLAEAGFAAQQTLQLHLHALEELLQGLGSRSSRHVMNRADLLVLEVMVHLAEGYRARYHELLNPPRQRCLPGFDHSTGDAERR